MAEPNHEQNLQIPGSNADDDEDFGLKGIELKFSAKEESFPYNFEYLSSPN